MLNKKEVHEKLKSDFLTENNLEEVVNTKVETTSYNLDNIDLDNEEIWLLQCPKGTCLSSMTGQKLKFPGRTNLEQFEVVTSEWQEKKQEAFGFNKHQERLGVRILPVKGNIFVRKSLKVDDDITPEQIEASYTHAGRPNMPEFIKIRHPLFGQSYKNKIKLKHQVEDRLQEADKSSLEITGDIRNNSLAKKTPKTSIKTEGVSKGEKKRKAVKRENNDVESTPSKKRSKIGKIKEEVADDLQWLQNV